jgi:alkylhydroperoxidase/carboxymuconolactone decarboxylase family protein YurZ
VTATTEDTSRYDIGAGILDKIFGPSWREKTRETGIKAADDLQRIAVEHTYTDAWARDALDFKTRSVICLSILTTFGHTTEELKLHVEAALANGWTHEDLFEIFLHMIPYLGVPKVVGALRIAGDTFMELWAREAAEAEAAKTAEN